ncbi:MAG: hypothetical protein M1836_006082 [Candelina mexicana]|nr:MAG: hypothetical protein M1836_006082 [Candelina mexicana]
MEPPKGMAEDQNDPRSPNTSTRDARGFWPMAMAFCTIEETGYRKRKLKDEMDETRWSTPRLRQAGASEEDESTNGTTGAGRKSRSGIGDKAWEERMKERSYHGDMKQHSVAARIGLLIFLSRWFNGVTYDNPRSIITPRV